MRRELGTTFRTIPAGHRNPDSPRPRSSVSIRGFKSSPAASPTVAPFLCSPRKSYTAEHPTKDASPERPPQGGSRMNPLYDSSHTSAYNDLQPPRNSYTRKDFKSFRFSTYKHFLMMLKTKDFKPFRISRSTIFARNPFGFSRYIKTWGGGGVPGCGLYLQPAKRKSNACRAEALGLGDERLVRVPPAPSAGALGKAGLPRRSLGPGRRASRASYARSECGGLLGKAGLPRRSLGEGGSRAACRNLAETARASFVSSEEMALI